MSKVGSTARRRELADPGASFSMRGIWDEDKDFQASDGPDCCLQSDWWCRLFGSGAFQVDKMAQNVVEQAEQAEEKKDYGKAVELYQQHLSGRPRRRGSSDQICRCSYKVGENAEASGGCDGDLRPGPEAVCPGERTCGGVRRNWPLRRANSRRSRAAPVEPAEAREE